MILLSTLWKTIEWKIIFFWYIFISLILLFPGSPLSFMLVSIIIVQMILSFIFILFILVSWNKVIFGHVEGLPILWIFSTVVEDIRVFEDEDCVRLLDMKDWCSDNCNKKWRHCKHGYFVFRSKQDAVLFKMSWV